ncbi:MAG: hypothetical protein IJP97_05535 [Synergistaceae bacterium]|nr:hypothetical protein [Synergistaceae bacterium]
MKRKLLFLSAILILILNVNFAFADDIVRISIARFISDTHEASDAEARAVTDIFTDTMVKTKSIAVIERERFETVAREQRLGMSALVDPSTAARVGKILGCQYVILGSVTHLSERTNRESFGKLYSKETIEAEASIYARVIDTSTLEIVYSDTCTERVSDSHESFTPFEGQRSTKDLSGQKQRAVALAAQTLSNKIREKIVGEAPHVISVRSGEIRINKGSSLGVHKGDLYLVYAEGETIYDIDGSVLDREVLNIALIEIFDVQNNYSTGRIPKGKNKGSAELIRRGDNLTFITRREADDLSHRGAFVKHRPRFSTEIPEPQSYPEPDPVRAAEHEHHGPHGFENSSTDPARVIPTYGLPAGEARAREDLHRRLQKAGSTRNAYNRYVEMANSFSGDYLAMYQAGIIAQSMGQRRDAAMWFDKALEANPDYEPALKAKENLNKPAPSRPARKRRK